jgi:hypothetical protein
MTKNPPPGLSLHQNFSVSGAMREDVAVSAGVAAPPVGVFVLQAARTNRRIQLSKANMVERERWMHFPLSFPSSISIPQKLNARARGDKEHFAMPTREKLVLQPNIASKVFSALAPSSPIESSFSSRNYTPSLSTSTIYSDSTAYLEQLTEGEREIPTLYDFFLLTRTKSQNARVL